MPDDVPSRCALHVRLKKHRDGRVALSCTRADGTVTWQRQDGANARFFPLHDLTHFAVETVLANPRGFFGLVATGWELSDFGAPWPRGRLPPEAAASELLVGLFDMERASGATWTLTDFVENAARHQRAHGADPTGPILTEPGLRAIRERMRELFARWDAVPPDGALELDFAAGHEPQR